MTDPLPPVAPPKLTPLQRIQIHYEVVRDMHDAFIDPHARRMARHEAAALWWLLREVDRLRAKCGEASA